MAGDYDGSEFVGLDQNTWGETSDASQDDTNTHALSTYLENRLDANCRYLQSRGSQVTYQFYQDTNSENLRPFTSIDRSALLYIPWPVQPNLKNITIYVFGEVINDDGGTTGKVDLYLSLMDLAGNRYGPKKKTITASGSPDVYKLGLDLSNENVAKGFGQIGVWVNSGNRPSVGSTSSTTHDEPHLFDVQNLATFDATTSLFSSDFSWRAVHRNADDSTSEVWSGVYKYGPANQPVSTDMVPVELSYLEPQSITIEEEFDETEAVGSYTAKTPFEMRAQKPVLGQHTARHGTNLDDTWGRERCLAIGPEGEDAGVDWPAGEKRKWTWHADMGSSSDLVLDNQMLQLRGDDSTVTCFAYVAFFRQSDTPLFGSYPDEAQEDFDSYIDWATPADAEFRVRIDQLTDGDTAWSGATEQADETTTLEDELIYFSAPVNFARLPTTFFFSRHPEGQAGVASDFAHTFREGQIWDSDRRLLVPVVISATLPSATNQADPVRATLEFSQFTDGPDYSNDRFDGNSTHLLCLQTSWFEGANL